MEIYGRKSERGTYQSLADRKKDVGKMRSKSSSKTPDLLAVKAYAVSAQNLPGLPLF
jgi:hypothetical protein